MSVVEFAPRGRTVSESELAPDKQLPDIEVRGVMAQSLSAGHGSRLPIVILKVDRGQLSAVVRTPRADGDGTMPVGDGVLPSSHLGRDIGGARQRGFSVGFNGECSRNAAIASSPRPSEPSANPLASQAGTSSGRFKSTGSSKGRAKDDPPSHRDRRSSRCRARPRPDPGHPSGRGEN